jgi:aminotransferase in exopolysaccharide biosynthesis
MYKDIIKFIQKLYNSKEFIPLHEPKFLANEKKYLNECIDSTFVSSVGKFVDRFEDEFASYVGSKYAVATINGTSALHIALVGLGVCAEDEVITQALSFVATSNAISYTGATPIFVDVDLDTLGLSPYALKEFLEQNCILENGRCINKNTKKTIKACVPMHTFGHPCKIDEIVDICKEWGIIVVEDSAESLGSLYKNKHTGTFGTCGIFSFNGNKIITSGSGGVVVMDDEKLAKRLKHLSTTAKVAHRWEYVHDEIGYNYRLSNLNAALLVAQLEKLDEYLQNKRQVAYKYMEFFKTLDGVEFIKEPDFAKSNYWLNGIKVQNKEKILEELNSNGIMSRPIWRLLSELDMYKDCQNDGLKNSKYLQKCVVNIPSSVRV